MRAHGGWRTARVVTLRDQVLWTPSIRMPIPTTGGQMKRLLLFAATCAVALFVAAPSFAATGVTLFGTATQEASDVKIVSDFSDTATTNDSGGVDIAVPAGTTFSSLTALSAQFQLQTGDCGGGSPRFQINVDGKNVFVYLGPSPSFTGCAAATWIDSGNLVGTSDACRVDTSQLAGGTSARRGPRPSPCSARTRSPASSSPSTAAGSRPARCRPCSSARSRSTARPTRSCRRRRRRRPAR